MKNGYRFRFMREQGCGDHGRDSLRTGRDGANAADAGRPFVTQADLQNIAQIHRIFCLCIQSKYSQGIYVILVRESVLQRLVHVRFDACLQLVLFRAVACSDAQRLLQVGTNGLRS